MKLLALLLVLASCCAQAQPFPSRPVRVMVGSAAGGGTDIISRLLAAKLQEAWGQPVLVENRTGASASIAADFVAKSPPVSSMRELVELAKANPGKLNFSSSGVGATQHLAGELFNLVTGVKTVHIPYKGSAAAMGDLIAGQVSMSFDTTASSIGNIRAGKLKALAVAAPARAAALRDVPTTAEAGYPGVEMVT